MSALVRSPALDEVDAPVGIVQPPELRNEEEDSAVSAGHLDYGADRLGRGGT